MGRRSSFTKATTERIYAALKRGNHRTVASQYAGLRPDTCDEWVRRASPDHPRYAPKYALFSEEVHRIEADVESGALAYIMRAGPEDPKYFQWYLERKFPERWGRKDRLALTGPQNGPIQTLNVSALPDDQLNQLIALVEQMTQEPPSSE